MPSRLDVNLARLANVATASTLLLAVFGYFYTVLPVFQNQKLQEDNARLELESARERKLLSELRDRQVAVQKKIAELDAALIHARGRALVSDERASLSEERERAARYTALLAGNRERDALGSARNAANDLASELRHLDTARRTILVSEFDLAVAFRRVRQHYEFTENLYRSTPEKNEENFVKAATLFLSPTKILAEAIEDMSHRPRRVPDAYLAELKGAVAGEKSITCVVPNAPELQILYLQKAGQIGALSAIDANNEIEKQRLSADKSNKRLIVTKKDIDSLTASIETGRQFSLRQEFRDKFLDADRQCGLLLDHAVKRIADQLGPKETAP
ncbi:hypothetical protein IV454_31365 [Massilia antarctica]|uniref:Uncharacterized protein n=1 Tax=Massilia antarctica TaxID=2765360 RepID=A0AA48WCG8_9BURK|nr:hypothetical protein [Massilia antarctica]QPI49857.1 hypothetical protein IV454_31365 [Massilia antarctica]